MPDRSGTTTVASTCPSPCTGRLVDEGIEAFAGAVGSSYDNAAARWVNRYNRIRPHLSNDDDISPAAAEHRHHRGTRHGTTNTPQNPRRSRLPLESIVSSQTVSNAMIVAQQRIDVHE